VRVHTGEEAARTTRTLGARALAVEHSIAIGRGEPSAGTQEGFELYAHEVAHVLQHQGGAPVVRRRLLVQTEYAGLAGSPGLDLLLALRQSYAAGLTTADRDAFRSGLLDAVVPVGNTFADAAATADLRGRAEAALAVTVRGPDGSKLDSFAVLSGLATLDQQAEADPLLSAPGSIGSSIGSNTMVRLLAEDTAAALIGALDANYESLAAFGRVHLGNTLLMGVDAITTPEGRYQLELEGTVLSLVEARDDRLNAAPGDRARLGAAVGQLARRALLLDAAIKGLRLSRGGAAGRPLDDQLRAAAPAIAAIRRQAEREETTRDALGNGADLLAETTLSTELQLAPPYNISSPFAIAPDEALPATTDRATTTMLDVARGELDRLSGEVTSAHEAIVPRDPRFTLEEFLEVYRRWLGLFSPERERRDPAFQLVMSFFDAEAQLRFLGRLPPNWNSLTPKQRGDVLGGTSTAYQLTGGPTTGFSAISGAFARMMMLELLEPWLEGSLHGASGDFASQYSSGGGSSLTASGSATAPALSLSAGVLVPTADGRFVYTDPAQATQMESSRTSQRFSSVARAPSQGPGATAADLQRLLGPRAASMEDAELVGVHETSAQEGWSYLVDIVNPMYPFPLVAREHRVVAPEIARYLLERQRLRQAGANWLTPTLPDGRRVGDVFTRKAGLAAAEATSEAVARGEGSPQPSAEVIRLRTALGTTATNARKGDSGTDAAALIKELEGYLDRFFTFRATAEWRIMAVITIAIQEQGVGADLKEAFSPTHLGKVVADSAELGFGQAFLSSFGPLGQVVNAGINGYMIANGCAPLQSVAGLLVYLRKVSQVTSFNQARAWAYLTRPIIGDLSNLLDTAASHATMGVVNEVVRLVQAERPTTPRQMAKHALALAKDPAARAAMLSAVEAQLSELGRSGQHGSAEYRALEAMQVELGGAVRRDRSGAVIPVDPAVKRALDEPIPGRRPEAETTHFVEFARPRTEVERTALAAAVPAEMGKRVRVVEDPLLSGRTVQVVAMGNEVQIRVGREATSADVASHVETARDMSRFVGPLGRIRALGSRIKQWLTGHPAFGTRGDEARREVEKLGRMVEELGERERVLDDRIAQLERGDAAHLHQTERAALRAEIESLERQLMLHFEEIGSLEAGRGSVAATDSRATVLDALVRAGRSREEAGEIVERAAKDGRLDALAQLTQSGAYYRLLAAGMSPTRIEEILDDPNGYGRLVRATIDPGNRAAAGLGAGVANALWENREKEALRDLTRSAEDALASEWGINAEGQFRASELPSGWTITEIERVADRKAEPPQEPRIVYRRWRYVQRVGRRYAEPFNEWARTGFQANVNREASSPFEAAAIGARKALPNNAPASAGGQKTYEYGEWVDERGQSVASGAEAARRPRGAKKYVETTTRPDGTRPRPDGGFDIVEHKHLAGETTVLNDSIQLRAQREMAASEEGGRHGAYELVMSSDRALDGRPPMPQVRPSGPLGRACDAVFYFDGTSGAITHKWSREHEAWERFP
jgi:hypothetical protein